MEENKPEGQDLQPQEQLAILPAGLISDLLVYLGTKPHTEVNPYIVAIQQSARLIKPSQVTQA
jgi:hypothetical protein